jgi:peptidoglycan/xylan/chitin deacetylase (PgdA/CDA1 family)
MLELCETYDVPATWAVVGHLMLEDCDGQHVSHPSGPAWFERERTDWQDRPDLRFGPDLVADIAASPVAHEIASHSFSHVLFGDDDTTKDVARAELRHCTRLAADWEVDLDSFVYPRNDVGHRGVLSEYGIGAYRGQTETPEGIRAVIDSLFGDRSLLVEPHVDDHGLVNVPASLFLFGFEWPDRGLIESLWTDPLLHVVRREIDRAAAEDGLLHLWLHPNNLVDERDDRRMRAILEYIDRRREADDLIVETMGEVARRVRTTQRDPVEATADPVSLD